MNYISISLYKKMLNHAIAEGMQPTEFSTLPTPIELVDEIKAVPADHFFELHELLEQKLGPGFSVRIGQQMKIADYGVLGLSWKTCSWAGEIFHRSERYFKLLSNTYVFKVEKGDEKSDIYLFRSPYRRGVALSNEATFSATIVVLQAMTDTSLTPISVAFQHGPPADLKSYQASFNCAILFNQPENCLSYKTVDLETKTIKADQSINEFLLERVDEETRGIEVSAGKVSNDVEKLIKEALPSGIPAIATIGQQLGMSNRTLTRRLSESGVTFRDLVRKTQENVSKELLKQTERSIAEIAFETGFSEQSAFNRAFKRWTQQSPLEFRKN